MYNVYRERALLLSYDELYRSIKIISIQELRYNLLKEVEKQFGNDSLLEFSMLLNMSMGNMKRVKAMLRILDKAAAKQDTKILANLLDTLNYTSIVVVFADLRLEVTPSALCLQIQSLEKLIYLLETNEVAQPEICWARNSQPIQTIEEISLRAEKIELRLPRRKKRKQRQRSCIAQRNSTSSLDSSSSDTITVRSTVNVDVKKEESHVSNQYIGVCCPTT